jgi:hypothetical protein
MSPGCRYLVSSLGIQESLMGADFSREAMQKLRVEQLAQRLQELHGEIHSEMAQGTNFSDSVDNIVGKLRDAGHPLYKIHWEADRTHFIWGSGDSWMNSDAPHRDEDGLGIEFRAPFGEPGDAQVTWDVSSGVVDGVLTS